ncbi:DUF6922 domain-containing protein [Parapedobacter sp. 10938]|uniref:DUF6922 domain-containing protein n=1 Tax=Parapedobacter flavus TaxID=3110225 RepID=UPI002DBDBB47|nr:hypothetical protein [Parapedobacter sp. 10938]MEC3881802.1 hypothetical protein [Parapedobacter sp. 10938]
MFRRAMFWDVDVDSLSAKKDRDFIIERVLAGSMRNPKYLENLEQLYPVRIIKRVAKGSKAIRGNDSIRFIADRYHMDPESFNQFIPGV